MYIFSQIIILIKAKKLREKKTSPVLSDICVVCECACVCKSITSQLESLLLLLVVKAKLTRCFGDHTSCRCLFKREKTKQKC